MILNTSRSHHQHNSYQSAWFGPRKPVQQVPKPQHQTSPLPQQPPEPESQCNGSPSSPPPHSAKPIVLFIDTIFGILFCEYLNEYEFDMFSDLNNEFKIKSVNKNVENIKCELEFCCEYDYGVMSPRTPPSHHHAPAPVQPPGTVLKFIGIIFCVFGYLKDYEFEIFGDLNNVENVLEFENVIGNCEFAFSN